MNQDKFFLIIILLMSCNCFREKDASRQDIYEKYGFLKPTITMNDTLLKSSIELTNKIISDYGVQIYNAAEDSISSSEISQKIPLYPIVLRDFSNGPGFTLPNERAIFIDIYELDNLHSFFVLNSLYKKFTEEQKAYANKALLTMIIVHEFSHLKLGHVGAFEGGINKRLNAEINGNKQNEFKADSLSARLFKEYQVVNKNLDLDEDILFWLTTSGIYIILNRAENNMSINKPIEAYLDQGYSHPNFELRLLNMMMVVNPDKWKKHYQEMIEKRNTMKDNKADLRLKR